MSARPTLIPPIRRTISVSWDPEVAFRRFTAEFGAWWPSSKYSIGGKLVERVVFECLVGGRIYEELGNGRRFQWGRVTAWEPPSCVAFIWHPSRDEKEAQDVVVRFHPEGAGTRLELVSTGWERVGPHARKMRKRYAIGWGAVLDRWAGRRTASTTAYSVLAAGVTLYQHLTGRGEVSIDKAGGRMPPDAT